MKHSGLKNEEKVSELLISGSLAIKTKNLSGVHLFEEKNKEAGIIFGKLTRPKYDDNEVYEFLSLLKKLSNTAYQYNSITKEEWISEVKQLKKKITLSIFLKRNYLMYKYTIHN